MVLCVLTLDVPLHPGAEFVDDVADSNPPSVSASVPPPPPAVLTVSDSVDVCVLGPPDPVIVMLYVPAGVVDAVLMVSVDVPDPGAAIDDGENVAVAPLGSPLALSETAELKPPDTVVVNVPVPEFSFTPRLRR